MKPPDFPQLRIPLKHKIEVKTARLDKQDSTHISNISVKDLLKIKTHRSVQRPFILDCCSTKSKMSDYTFRSSYDNAIHRSRLKKKAIFSYVNY
jgi:hypothetical protein